MQSQFGSISLVAAAYERELRADAVRVRPVRIAETDEATECSVTGRVREVVGRGLVQIGERLLRTRSLKTGGSDAIA